MIQKIHKVIMLLTVWLKNPNLFSVRIWDGTNIATLYEIFVLNQYNNDFGRPKTIVDLGANVGYASIFFSIKYPDANIYAFEPDPINYIRLCKNTSKYKKIKTFNLAISKFGGEMSFYQNKSGITSSLIPKKAKKNGVKIKVNTISPEELVKITKSIDLLKFDIEGSEYDLFESGKFAKHIIGEYHESLVGLPIESFVGLFDFINIKQISNNKFIVHI